MVGFPERENIILTAGFVTLPEDGSGFDRYTIPPDSDRAA
jgi:hypothetical protein